MYQPRLYRAAMNQERFRFFTVSHFESDLLIGVPHADFCPEMKRTCQMELVRLRKILLRHSKSNPLFASSLDPLPLPEQDGKAPEEVITMIRCGQESGTGPMSTVAGLFAEYVGHRLIQEYNMDEVVIENGGDLYIQNMTELISVIHAGDSPLSDKMAFAIPPGTWGICTSSGTIGHSFSLGKADAVTVIAKSAALADAWATSLANKVMGPEYIEPVLDQIKEIPAILACAIIAGERIGFRGGFELKLLT